MERLYRVPFPPNYGSMRRLEDTTPEQQDHIRRTEEMKHWVLSQYHQSVANALKQNHGDQ